MTAGIIAADQDASVLLIEKSPQYGGSSAMSGGELVRLTPLHPTIRSSSW